MATFQVFRDRIGEYRYRLLADNGEPILASEGYTTKASLLRRIDSVRRNAPYDTSYRRHQTHSGYYFSIVASNGEIIGRSGVYSTIHACDNGVEAVKRIALMANAIDLA
ncbi:MAG: YegP family protein [Bacteroidetes bacterium]|nr:YegP family protein [Bacteroidota bacterium]